MPRINLGKHSSTQTQVLEENDKITYISEAAANGGTREEIEQVVYPPLSVQKITTDYGDNGS